ncbi:MAG TPA: alpha/beta fold hydrolase [Candidatus Eisenbacteria bacterium]|nr:alpha/beta fold hydrolase [Candidatus Eisenbacteria bacterium]
MERQGETNSWTTGLRGLRVLGSELSALVQVVSALPRRSLATDTLDDGYGHPIPCVLVHGVLGDSTNFTTLRRHLARHGIRRFSSFGYRPRLDYQRLTAPFGEHVSRVCRETAAPQVDVVAHSLGGLVVRYFVQTVGAHLVRRLVTLGTPYLACTNPSQELSIFAEHDAIVPPPLDGAHRRMHVIEGCGHLGLLTDERVLAAVLRDLIRPTLVVGRVDARAA